MTGRLKLGSLMSVAALTITHLATGGSRHMAENKYSDADRASRIEQRAAEGDLVVFDASVPVDFILSLRRENPDKRFVMFPYAGDAGRSGLKRSEQIERRMLEARAAIGQRGVKYVVVSDLPDTSHTGSSLLAALRWNQRFELLGTYPLPTESRMHPGKLYLYENTGASQGE